ncbi:acyl-coenzyme a oxidase 2 [Saitoella complicata NRRL Y-17804]|uniref:acyl-coenzyme a oxidase 2 n=1 Tax=Saitoella complicata (strain BCRC 22490 / CBS 7301 / JCM 7358 / NBRC 10748 / NRRL Y-17804) TaxID=698492 RepID=UPI000867E490|nr:acyl-coenzyme a oxidase 2 [Saitoella complicata NRRL Y-17804]ODQ51405.1 acyl-coenzyme a oxidase 2 [Saitoella complicata NRRL Y-17804]
MNEERSRTSFPIREMTYFIDKGAKITQLKEKIMLQIERDPVFKNDDWYDLNKEQVRERTMMKFKSLIHYVTSEPETVTMMRMNLISVVDPGFFTRFGVHYGLFFGALRGSATPSQLSYWISKGAAGLNGMIGCFAMTELGHGSNVQGLETTATFDPKSDEFVIHTPSLSATKWWIGGAAHSATHSVVFARLIVNKKDHGVKSFVVPLRDPSDYSLRPGVTIGDIGKKMGRDGIDNGFIQFSQVRIPRSYMLMKHIKVTRTGEVKSEAMAQLTYGALIAGRVSMVVDSASVSKRVLTIAIRYAGVRRQFSSKPGEIESKILDYALHQRRLMPLLAQTFAMQFAGDQMEVMYRNLMSKLDSLNPEDKAGMAEVVDSLKEVHATSAGLKAFCTWACLETINTCRLTCGGHGYSSYNGFANAHADFSVQCTWEGDNAVLALQAGRSLIGSWREAKKGKKLPEGVRYLSKGAELKGAKCGERGVGEVEVILQAWDAVAASVVNKAGAEFERLRSTGLSADEAYEETSQLRFTAAKTHVKCYLVSQFFERIRGAPESLKRVLMDVALLYALWSIEEDAGAFLSAGYFTPGQMDEVRSKVNELCKEVRMNAIGLCDSFNYSDFFINAPIGRYDGNIYPHYFEQVRKQNPFTPAPPYFKSVIKPLINRSMEDGNEEIDMEDDE